MTSEKHTSVINPNSGLPSPICLMDSRLQEFAGGASVIACAFLIDCPTCDLQTRIKRLRCHPLMLLMMVVVVWADRSFCYGEANYRNNGCRPTGSPRGQSIKGQDILDSPEVIRSPPITRGLPLHARSLADWTSAESIDFETAKARNALSAERCELHHCLWRFLDVYSYDKWCCCFNFRGWATLLVYFYLATLFQVLELYKLRQGNLWPS